MDIEKRKKLFLKIFKKAEKHYSKTNKRLAGEGWKYSWQTLIATIMSAQTTDEVTIPSATKLFKKYKTLKIIAKQKPENIKKIISKVNYNNTKARHIVLTSQMLVNEYKEKIPNKIEELIKLPGVGRKVANLILGEEFKQKAICVDTHVHRISNIFRFVKTKTPEQTEKELMKIVPKRYWNKINRIFVLWGKDVKGYDKKNFLEKIK